MIPAAVLDPSIKPEQSGYNFTRNSGLVVTNLEGGPPRVRRGYANALTEMGLQFRCTPAQYDYLQAFYRDEIQEGLKPFWIMLIMEASEPMPHMVWPLPNTFGLSSVSGATYIVEMTVRCKPYKASDMLAFGNAVRAQIRSGRGFYDVDEATKALLPATGEFLSRGAVCMPTVIALTAESASGGWSLTLNRKGATTGGISVGFTGDVGGVLNAAATAINATYFPDALAASLSYAAEIDQFVLILSRPLTDPTPELFSDWEMQLFLNFEPRAIAQYNDPPRDIYPFVNGSFVQDTSSPTRWPATFTLSDGFFCGI